MLEFVGFQTMGILVPYGISFGAEGVFGLAFHLLFKPCSTYCVLLNLKKEQKKNVETQTPWDLKIAVSIP